MSEETGRKRIKVKNGFYYPQYRNFLGFWCSYTEVTTMEGMTGAAHTQRNFRTLEEAQEYLKNREVSYVEAR